MPIDIKEPIVVPSKTFNTYWVCSVNISAPSPEAEASADVSLLPFNSETKEVLATGCIAMRIENIMQKAVADPSGNFAKAMHFLVEAIKEEKESKDA